MRAKNRVLAFLRAVGSRGATSYQIEKVCNLWFTPVVMAKLEHAKLVRSAFDPGPYPRKRRYFSITAAPIDREVLQALQAICEGYPCTFADGYICVENPEASAEAVALGGVNPNLVIDCGKLLAALK